MLNITHHQGNTNQNHTQYHLTPVRVAEMNKSGDYRCRRGCGETGTLLHCWWEWKLVQLLWKTVWSFLKKLKIEFPYNPAIALLGIYPRDTGVLMHRGTCTPMFIVALSTITKLWKEPKCPSTDEWIKKMWFRGAWVAQLVKRPTSAHVMILRSVSSSPASGSVLMA